MCQFIMYLAIMCQVKMSQVILGQALCKAQND